MAKTQITNNDLQNTTQKDRQYNEQNKSQLIIETLYTDILGLGGVFAKNTSRETKNFPSRMASEI
jgi:hypothetical protein